VWLTVPTAVNGANGGYRTGNISAVLIGCLAAMPQGSGCQGVGARRLRIGGLVTGSIAVVLMAIVGCTGVTSGTAVVYATQAPAYRTSMSLSISASAEKSSLRESERQESLTTQAVHSACESLIRTSDDAIDMVNAFVDAVNVGSNSAATAGLAVESLNNSADAVEQDLSDAVPANIRDALSGWVDSAREVADVISTRAGPVEFNTAIDQVNDARSEALELCDDTY